MIFRLVAEEMNDPKMLFDILSFKRVDTETWFWKFRLPQIMAEGGVEPVSFKSGHISEAQTSGNGLGFEIQPSMDMLPKLKRDYKNEDLSDLQELMKEMGGVVNIKAEAKIAKMYGILPNGPKYEIPGVTYDLSEAKKFTGLNIGYFLDNLMSDKPFKLDLTQLLLDRIPDYGIGDLVEKAIGKISFNLALEWVAIPIPVGKLIGALFRGLTTRLNRACAPLNTSGDVGSAQVSPTGANVSVSIGQSNLTLKGFLKNALLKDINLSVDFSAFKKAVRDKLLGVFPESFRLGHAGVNWGVTMEKIGIMEVKTTVVFQPQGKSGVTIRKTLAAQRDFRVADIQPVAPDYSFFIANSILLFEDSTKENTNNFAGDEQIQWEAGIGKLVVHNITLFDEKMFKKFKEFFSAIFRLNLEKANYSFFFPGRVRINGTKPSKIRLNFGLLDFIKDGDFGGALRGCEIAALLVNRDTKHSPHNILPSMGESLYGLGFEMPPIWGGWVTLFNLLEGLVKKAGTQAIDALEAAIEDTAAGNYDDGGAVDAAIQGQKDALKQPADEILSTAESEVKEKATEVLNEISATLQDVGYMLRTFDWPWVTDSMIWIPMPKLYNKTYLFGDFHCEFPITFRVEGNVYKEFSRLKLPMIRIFIFLNWLFSIPNVDITLPPIPMNEVITEPYGFCAFPPCEDNDGKADVSKMATEWNPNDPKNLPANVYSPYQYLKK
ncbi:hypothetical protein HYY75_06790, partial [bacterium]|nr:hypothetical protein [bacterium]